jgi:uncharacterized membrane protein
VTETDDREVEVEVEAEFAQRVITFSDAVVAIAITLLALGLTPPDGVPGWTNGQLLHALRGDWSQYFAFLLSFAVIGNHWATHRRITRYVVRMNAAAARLNMVWLLMMVLTPVATRLLSVHGADGIRFTIYVLIQVIATVCLMLMTREYARGGLLRAGAPERARHPSSVPYLAIIIPFLMSIPVAFFTGWAYAVWAAIPLTGRVLRHLTGNGRHATSDVTPGHETPSARIKG